MELSFLPPWHHVSEWQERNERDSQFSHFVIWSRFRLHFLLLRGSGIHGRRIGTFHGVCQSVCRLVSGYKSTRTASFSGWSQYSDVDVQNGDKWRARADVNLAAHTHAHISWRWGRRRIYMTSQSLRVEQGKYSNKDENTRWIDGSVTQLPPNSVKCFPSSCVGFLPLYSFRVWTHSVGMYPSLFTFNAGLLPISSSLSESFNWNKNSNTIDKREGVDEKKLFKLTQTTAKGNPFRNQQSQSLQLPSSE